MAATPKVRETWLEAIIGIHVISRPRAHSNESISRAANHRYLLDRFELELISKKLVCHTSRP
jgi:hypothetical protein